MSRCQKTAWDFSLDRWRQTWRKSICDQQQYSKNLNRKNRPGYPEEY